MHLIVVSVENRVKDLHKGITQDKQILLAFLVDVQNADGGLAETAFGKAWVHGTLKPVVAGDIVGQAINDKGEISESKFCSFHTRFHVDILDRGKQRR